MRKLIVVLAALAAFAIVPSAFAWSGSQWSKDTCGAELSTPAEGSGNWWVHVQDETGKVLFDSSSLSAKNANTDVGIGAFESDSGFHSLTFSVANAANHNDGLVTYTKVQANCFVQGTPGPAGPKGDKGDKGDTGAKGDKGDKGDTGSIGRTTPGTPGPAGPKGDTGAQGPKGDTGQTGAKGEKGDRGERGPRGLPGKPGKNGKNGKDGTCACKPDKPRVLPPTP